MKHVFIGFHAPSRYCRNIALSGNTIVQDENCNRKKKIHVDDKIHKNIFINSYR